MFGKVDWTDLTEFNSDLWPEIEDNLNSSMCVVPLVGHQEVPTEQYKTLFIGKKQTVWQKESKASQMVNNGQKNHTTITTATIANTTKNIQTHSNKNNKIQPKSTKQNTKTIFKKNRNHHKKIESTTKKNKKHGISAFFFKTK